MTPDRIGFAIVCVVDGVPALIVAGVHLYILATVFRKGRS